MNSRVQHAINRANTATDRALNVASTCGRLRRAAREVTGSSRRHALRELARKIEKRKSLQLTVGWWLNKAEEMMR